MTNQFNNQKEQTASDVAAALLPVMVGYEVMIDGSKVAPVASIEITQEYGDHHILRLQFWHELVQAEGAFTIDDAQTLLGKPATVVIKNLNNPAGGALECKFIIADVALDQEDLNEGMLHLTGYSPTWLLDGAPHYESFTGKSLKEIAVAVAKPLAQVNSGIKANPTFANSLSFVCRYDESAWNFLKRLSNETGQWLYFNGSDLVFGKAESGKAVKLTYGQDCYHMHLSMKTAPVQTGLFDYDAAQASPINEPAGVFNGSTSSYMQVAFKQSRTLFSHPAHAVPQALGGEKSAVEAMGKARAEGLAASLYTMKGESKLFMLKVGSIIDVEFKRMGQSASHGQMRIISVKHTLTDDGNYSNTFEAISVAATAPPPIRYDKPATHPMLAKVTDNKDPFGQGRIKVEFMGWQGDNGQQTDWIRVSSPNAGSSNHVSNNRGFMFVPEINDELLIDFENGNPDKPFVAHCLYHGRNGAGGGSANHIKSIATRSGCLIQFDDTDGQGSITLSDPSGNMILMDGHGNININAPKNININAGENISMTAGMNVSVSAGMNILESAGENKMLNVGMIMKTHVGGNHLINVVGDSIETIKGDFKSLVKERTEVAQKGHTIQSVQDSVRVMASQEIQKHSGEKSLNS
jgi:uncharacterized protein involved in type VI secretion and phage assembly